VGEPGRRGVKEELARDGTPLPWIDIAAFARRAVEVALSDRDAALDHLGRIFFDRGLVDVAYALEYVSAEPVLERLGRMHRYHVDVFLTPPWPEIFGSDPERRHGFDEPVAEYERLERAYRKLDY
jgi:predicted ATPase